MEEPNPELIEYVAKSLEQFVQRGGLYSSGHGYKTIGINYIGLAEVAVQSIERMVARDG